jgi:hypothetical protein
VFGKVLVKSVEYAVQHGTEEFLILPHESVRATFARKAGAVDAWIDDMATQGG